MQSAFDVIVTGRVQGVFFRDFVVTRARELGLAGETENLLDESVRVSAEGEREHLDALLDAIKKGPSTARVRSVSVVWVEPSGAFSEFSIKQS